MSAGLEKEVRFMQRADVNGIKLEYEVQGSGEPVVFIHGSHVADSFAPLMAEPALKDRLQLIRYHRRGFAGSSRHTGRLPIAGQAADCLGLLRHFGIAQAHVVGHSYGGVIVSAARSRRSGSGPLARRCWSLRCSQFPAASRLAEMMGRIAAIYEVGRQGRAQSTLS